VYRRCLPERPSGSPTTPPRGSTTPQRRSRPVGRAGRPSAVVLSALVLIAVTPRQPSVERSGDQGRASAVSASPSASASTSEKPFPSKGPRAGRVSAPLIAAAGDIACEAHPCAAQRATARLVRLAGPRAVLALGDTQYQRGTWSDYQNSYDPTWGTFKKRTYPTPGDHEYETARARGYFGYFGRRAHPPRGRYAFDLGSWHVVSLNSEGAIRRQTRWLGRNLRRDDHRCELAFWHEPRWSSATGGNHAAFAPWWDVLYGRGVDVVLNGDQHQYERFAKLGADGDRASDGVRQFVVGTGGAELLGVVSAADLGSQRRVQRHGILTMRLWPTRYHWRFIAVGGAVLDSGVTRCHG
jgi:hypothetical protein